MKILVTSTGETLKSPFDSRFDRALKCRKHCSRPTSCFISRTPERLVSDYLAGTLLPGENVCNHADHHDGKGGEHGHQRT